MNQQVVTVRYKNATHLGPHGTKRINRREFRPDHSTDVSLL